MMNNWFKKADFYLRTAMFYYNEPSEQKEDYNVALACYFLESSIEFNIKGLIEKYCGIIFEKSSSLCDSLAILESEKDNIKHYDKIESIVSQIDSNAQEISSWRNEAIYNFDFHKSKGMIQEVVDIAGSLNKFTSATLNDDSSNKSGVSVSLYKMDLIGKTYKEKCEVIRKFMKEFYHLDIPQEYNTPIHNSMFWINEHSEDDIKGYCDVGYMIGYTDEYIHEHPAMEYFGGSYGFSSFEALLDNIVECKTLDEFLGNGAVYMRSA